MAKSNLTISIAAKNKASGQIKEVSSSFDKLSNSVGALAGPAGVAAKAIAAATAAAAAGVTALIAVADKAAKAADATFVAAQRIGTSSKFLSQMQFAADQAGNSSEELRTALTALTRRASAMPETFKKWGIAVRGSNGEIKDTETLALEVADKMQSLNSAAERAAMAQDLMSEAGRKLVPMLADGSAGLRDMFEESDRLGNTLSDNAAALGNEYVNQVGKATSAISGLAKGIGERLQPFMINMAKLVTDIAVRTGQWIQKNKEFINTKIVEYVERFADSAIPALVTGVRLLLDAFYGLREIPAFAKVVFNDFSALVSKSLSDFTGKIAQTFEGTFLEEKLSLPFKRVSNVLKSASSTFQDTADSNRSALAQIVRDAESSRAKLDKLTVSSSGAVRGLSGRIKLSGGGAAGNSELPNLMAPMLSPEPKRSASKVFSASFNSPVKKAADAQKKAQELQIRAQERLAEQISGPLSNAFNSIVFSGRSVSKTFGSMIASFAQRAASSVIGALVKSAVKLGVTAVATYYGGPGAGAAAGGAVSQAFASGGLVVGPSGIDRVPAMLTAGEFVLPKSVVDSIRAGKPPETRGLFNSGGFVTPSAGASAGGGTTNVIIQSVAPPNSATVRRDIAIGLSPVLDDSRRRNGVRLTARTVGRLT